MNYFDILLAKKLEDDRDPKVEGLSVTENGRYHEDGVVYDPVIVEIPEPTLISKSITANGTYTASDDNADGYSSVSVNVPLPSNAYLLQTKEHESIATFDDGTDNFVKSLEVAIEPIQSGSGEPSPENIRPISGWDEVNVSVSGVNVWDEEWEVGGIRYADGQNVAVTDRIRSKNYIPILPNTSYYYIFPNGGAYFFYDENKTFISAVQIASAREVVSPSNAYFTRLAQYPEYGTTYNNDISINYPSTDTEYHAYNGNTYTIDLDGTRYGGKLDVINGLLTVTHVVADLGDLNWTYNTIIGNHPVFTTQLVDSISFVSDSDIICSQYVTSSVRSSSNATVVNAMNDKEIAFKLMSKQIFIYDSAYTDATTFKTAMDGVQLVYELATPQTIQLTPTIIKSLQGDNNFFASTGEVIKLQYWGKEQS